MEVRDIVYITAFALALLIPLIFYNINLKNSREAITHYLSKRGATNISIHHDWFDTDRDTLTFDVVYTGINGNKQTTRCKLRHLMLFIDQEIFWSDPLNMELMQIAEALPRSEYYELSENIRSKLTTALPTYEISTVLPIQNSNDQIVMLQYTSAFRNILRCKPDGSVVWQAELPTKIGDVYTNVTWRDGHITAFSRSLVTVHLDVETGKILPTVDVSD